MQITSAAPASELQLHQHQGCSCTNIRAAAANSRLSQSVLLAAPEDRELAILSIHVYMSYIFGGVHMKIANMTMLMAYMQT